MKHVFQALAVAGAMVTGAFGCGGDDKAECEAIVEACHAVDPGSGPIHECHENAEETWTKDQCVAMSAGCLAICKPADGGVR